MNFFAHIVAGIGLFFGSLFGVHTGVISTTAPVGSASSTVAANTTVSASAKPTSFFGKIASFVAPAASVPATTSVPATSVTGQSASASTVPVTQPAPSGTASIDQKRNTSSSSVKETSGYYSVTELTGSASNASSVTIVLVPADQSDTSWTTVSSAALSRMQTATVSKGRWLVDFKGIDGGSYSVLIYDGATHALLNTSPLSIQGPETSDVLAYVPVTIGIGQSAIGALLTAHVVSISGSAASPTVNLSFDLQNAFGGKKISAKIGDQLPSPGVGFDYDVITYAEATNVLVKDISYSEKTVTLIFRSVATKAKID